MYIVERVLFKWCLMYYPNSLMVYIVERVLFKGLMVYIVELVLCKLFNGVLRRTCTVQRV